MQRLDRADIAFDLDDGKAYCAPPYAPCAIIRKQNLGNLDRYLVLTRRYLSILGGEAGVSHIRMLDYPLGDIEIKESVSHLQRGFVNSCVRMCSEGNLNGYRRFDFFVLVRPLYDYSRTSQFRGDNLLDMLS